MAEAGILSEDDRVELIRGEVLAMSPIGPRHNAAVLRANQSLVRLDEYDEPQPDVYLLRPKEDFYASGHAGPSDLFLIIEMADSSLEYDQGLKMHLYAEMGVPEYWVSDIRNDRLIAYSEPRENNYAALHLYRRGDTITPSLLPGCQIPVHVLLP